MSQLITVTKKLLSSRLIRNVIGERVIDFFADLVNPTNNNNGGGGWLGFILEFGKKLIGFLLSVIEAGIRWLLKNLMDILVEAYYTIAYFDWNTTDKQIQEQINSNNNAIGSALGNLTGTSLVWLAGLSIAGTLALKFPVVAGRVALDIADEGGSEIRGALLSFLTQVRNTTVNNFILSTFLSARQAKLFGMSPVTKERQPWILAEKVDEAVTKLSPNDFIKNFLQSFLGSVEDSLISMGYVISFTLDDFYSNHLAAQQTALGTTRTIIMTPNREEDDERIVLSGPQELITNQINQTLATHTLVYNRDMGIVVGEPAREFANAEYQTRKLVVVFKSKDKPPWRDNRGKISKQVTITIPEIKRGINWQAIKSACKAYEWGRFMAIVRLEGERKIRVYGASESIAKDKAKDLAQLTNRQILSVNVVEEVERPDALRKRPTRMYPAYATLLTKNATSSTAGQADITGQRWEKRSLRVNLWPDLEPSNSNQLN